MVKSSSNVAANKPCDAPRVNTLIAKLLLEGADIAPRVSILAPHPCAGIYVIRQPVSTVAFSVAKETPVCAATVAHLAVLNSAARHMVRPASSGHQIDYS